MGRGKLLQLFLSPHDIDADEKCSRKAGKYTGYQPEWLGKL
jgi:hypothetical protein